MMNKNLAMFLIGLVSAIAGAFMFMSNIVVSGIYSGFYAFGGSGMFHVGASTCGVIIIALAIAIFALIVNPNKITRFASISLFMLFIVAMILSLRFSFKPISGASLFIMIGLLVIGLGLIVRSLLGTK